MTCVKNSWTEMAEESVPVSLCLMPSIVAEKFTASISLPMHGDAFFQTLKILPSEMNDDRSIKTKSCKINRIFIFILVLCKFLPSTTCKLVFSTNRNFASRIDGS